MDPSRPTGGALEFKNTTLPTEKSIIPWYYQEN